MPQNLKSKSWPLIGVIAKGHRGTHGTALGGHDAKLRFSSWHCHRNLGELHHQSPKVAMRTER